MPYGNPLFAQLLQTRSREGKFDGTKLRLIFIVLFVTEVDIYQPAKVARMDTNESLLLDISSWTGPEVQNLISAQPEVNNINQTEYSGSRRNTPSEIPNWNIPSDDFTLGTNVNLDSASGICQVLNMDCNQIELEPIHISSGDLDMAERLSGSFQEYLVI